MISKEAILAKTHYGTGIYSHILRQFYPGETVMKISGRDCGICRNPFADGNETLHVWTEKIHPEQKLSDEIARHKDQFDAIPEGDCFDFAKLYWKKDGQDLLIAINENLYLHLEDGYSPYDRNSVPVKPLPVFSPAVRDLLPAPLDTIAAQSTSDEDCDMLILGALCVLSSCLPHISGVYHGRRVYPNFFLFVTAGASAGKGRLTLCRHLAEAIDDDLHQRSDEEEKEYKKKMQEYKAAKNKAALEIPEEPPMLMHYIPANSSATVVYQILNDNGGSGMMFESEGDTLANIFASDYGKYSDGFRKAFHHENISFARRKDRERVFIKEPKLSALLTGTPNQILNLITDAENGLFSRFAFYCLQTELVWLSPFAYKEEVTQDDFFLELGAGVKDLYDILKAGKDLRFSLTEEQEQDFDSRFSYSQMALYNQYGDAIVASIRRLGLITYRIAMILSALRLTEDGDFESDIVCLDQDYQTAAAICEALVAHMARVYKMLPETPVAIKSKRSDKPKVYQRFYDALPDTFDRKTYSDVAVSVGLNPRSVDRTIKEWCDEGCLEKPTHGQYAKVR